MIKNPWFWIFLVIKIIFFWTTPSHVATDLFIPFLDKSIHQFGENPWAFFSAEYFPYGSVLYTIVVIPKFLFYLIFGEAAMGSTFVSFLSLRLPILVADICMFRLLLKWPSARDPKWLYFFYWMNPALIYINYVHVQLDIFAVLFLLYSLDLIKTKKEIWSSISLAASILCKFHIAILVPLFISYFWNNFFKKKAFHFLVRWTATLLALVALGFLPHVFSNKIGYISFLSPEALKIFSLSFSFDGQNELYIGFGIVISVLGRLLISSRITRQGLFFSCGVILGLLIVTTSAMPGWYYWFYPFAAVFLSQYITRLHYIVLASFVFYLAYFLSVEKIIFLPNPLPAAMFTLLQVSTLGLIYSFWLYIIRHEMPWSRRNRPLLVGIAGDSGSGKSRLSSTLQSLFGQNSTSFIEGDDYHKWERNDVRWEGYTHLNPRANSLEELSADIVQLLQGRAILKSHYNHDNGKFTSKRLISTKKNMIVQGLHTFYPIHLRRLFDIKIYLNTDENLRLFWKVKRDYFERKKPIEDVIKSIKNRAYDSLLHIRPQMHFSDWIIEYLPMQKDLSISNKLHMDEFIKNEKADFFQVHRLKNDTPLERLIVHFEKIPTIQVRCENDLEDMDFIKLTVIGKITSEEVEHIATSSFDILRHLTRSNHEPVWQANYDGVNQLIFLSLVLRAENTVL